MGIRKCELPFGVLIKQVRVVLLLLAMAVTVMRIVVTATIRAAWCRLRDANRANGRRPRCGDGPHRCAAAAHGLRARGSVRRRPKLAPKLAPKRHWLLSSSVAVTAHGCRLNYDLAARGRKRPP